MGRGVVAHRPEAGSERCVAVAWSVQTHRIVEYVAVYRNRRERNQRHNQCRQYLVISFHALDALVLFGVVCILRTKDTFIRRTSYTIGYGRRITSLAERCQQ